MTAITESVHIAEAHCQGSQCSGPKSLELAIPHPRGLVE
jgi:hypothetical protein